MKHIASRRSFLAALGLGAGTVALFRNGRGAEPQKLDPRDSPAAALGYVENAAQVDIKRYPGYVKDSNCGNCLQLQGTAGSDYRPCSLFPGKLVAVAGWCSGWTAEM